MGKGTFKPSSPKGIANGERITRAIELRKQGKTWDEIAADGGWANRSTPYKVVTRELAKQRAEPTEAMLKLELARLDAMQDALWEAATTPATGKTGALIQARAVQRILGIMDRRARLLGLDDFERRSIELAEKKHQLAGHQARLVYELMNRVFNQIGLTAEQRALLPTVVPGALAELTEKADDDEVEAD